MYVNKEQIGLHCIRKEPKFNQTKMRTDTSQERDIYILYNIMDV